ncbi:MAG: VWA domain-containing protein [Anaerolineae bacterium]
MKQQHEYSSQRLAMIRRKAMTILAILAPALAVVWLLGGLVWLGEVSLAQGTRVAISPSSAQVAVGETVNMDVRIEDATSLWGARVYLTFDPTILEVVDADTGTEGVQIARGDFIDPREGRSWALVNQADNAAGTVEYASVLLNNARNPTPPASGSGVLARITFRGLAQGSSPVAFSSQNVELFDEQGRSVQTITQDGSVEVSAGVKVYLPVILKQRAQTQSRQAGSGTPARGAPGRASGSGGMSLGPHDDGSVCEAEPAPKPAFLTEHVGPDLTGDRYSYYYVWYTTDCGSFQDCDCDGQYPEDCVPSVDDDGDGVPNVVETVAYTLAAARDRLVNDNAFREPFFCSPQERQVWIYNVAAGGYAWPTQISLNRDSLVISGTQQVNLLGAQSTALHELFHNTEFGYIDAGIWGTWGGWLVEGGAVLAEDSLFPDPRDPEMQDLDHSEAFPAWVQTYLKNPNVNITTDVWYGMAVLWKYLVEQHGTTPSDPNVPDWHLDALRILWEKTADMPPDSIGAVERALADLRPGVSFEDLFIDFLVANYLKEISGPSVPDQYKYRDNQEVGAVTLGNVARTLEQGLAGDTVIDDNLNIEAWGAHYFEIEPLAGLDVLTLEFHADHSLAYVLLLIKGNDLVNTVTPRISRDFVQTVVNDGYDAVVAIVGGLEDGGSFSYSFDSHTPTLNILSPLTSQPALVGDPSAPEKFMIRLEVLSPGADPWPVSGIPLDSFTVSIEGTPLTEDQIISAAEVQDQYWLVVQSPTQTTAGLYDLTVSVGAATDTETDAVNYAARVAADNVLVIDKSGSMALHEKMEDAQNAARLFASSWYEGDKIGVVSFNADATVDYSLHDWTTDNWYDAITAINSISAGGTTSIGAGLLTGLGEVTGGDQNHDWLLVLLSDGLENTAPYISDFMNTYAAREAGDEKNPVVYAIAIGPDANRPDLQRLADDTGGQYFYVAEPSSGGVMGVVNTLQERQTADLANDLAEFYRVIAENVAHRQQVYSARGSSDKLLPDQPFTHTISIDSGASEAVFVVNWRRRDSLYSPRVQLLRPDGIPESPDIADNTHVVYRVTSPAAGNWQVGVTRWCDQYDRCFEGTYLVEAAEKSDLTMDLFIGPAVADRVEGAAVPILVSLTSSAPVSGATVNATIQSPGGTVFSLQLYDDGQHGDGGSGDGLYGNTFTQATEAGSYVVRAVAQGTTALTGPFQRRATGSFHLEPDANDDGDCLPDSYEKNHGLDPTRNDGNEDPDMDGLTNCQEYENGTNPQNPDTDDAGQDDGSELSGGQDPLDPSDDALRPPRDLRVSPGNGENALYFGVQFTYDHMMIYRSLGEFGGYTLINGNAPATAPYVDTGLTNGTTYWYRVRAVDAAGNQSRLTRPVSGTPKTDPLPPQGEVLINGGARSTTSLQVQLTLEVIDDIRPFPDAWRPGGARLAMTQAGIQMRIANDPAFEGVQWQPFSPSLAWTIAPEGRWAYVFVQFRDAAGNVSQTVWDSIRYFQIQPPACPRGGQVDVVFLMDTSGSMDDEFQTLCDRIDQVVWDLQAQDITVQYEILGITQNKLCATDNVAGRFPNAAADTPEDWGTAVADVAGNYPWHDGYTRLIIPMSDEGPADGDPAEDPGADREIIDAAIQAAQAQQVIVSPVLGTFISQNPGNQAAIEHLAADLAQATGGQVFRSTDPAGDLAEGLSNLIGSAACTPVPRGVHPNCDVDSETIVRVFGQNFLEDAQVLVGGQPARDVTVLQDPERIAFRIPEGLADGTYGVTVVNPGVGQYTLPAALTVGSCTERCEASQAGDIWTPMWDLWDGDMGFFPVADGSGTLTMGVYNGEGNFVVTLFDAEGTQLDQVSVPEGETRTISTTTTEDAQYRANIQGSGADHPHFRAFFRGAKRVAIPDSGDDWERTEGVPFPGSGVDHGVESNPELGFDERWQDVSNVYADTIWYFHVSQSGTPLRVRVWSEYPEGDGHGGMEWVTPDEITIPLVGAEPAGFYHTFEAPEPQTGWWGLRIKADAPFTPWAQHYSLSHVSPGGGEVTPPDYIYLLPTSMKAPPCGPSVTLDPPRKGACKSSVVPVDITVSDVSNLYGAEVHLSFDPDKLEVVDATRAVTDVIIPGPFPDAGEGQRLVAQNYADNISGTIDYAVTLLDPAPAAHGNGLLARILFHVKEPGASVVRFLEGSKLDERPIPPFGPKPIPADWQGGLLIGRDCVPGQAGQGQIDGRVILQARRNHSGAVVVAPPWPHPQITGADGTYSLAPLSLGTYAMVITHTGYLRTEPLTVTVSAGQPISVPTAILLGGDVNGDSKISFVDAVIISRAFTYARGEQGYVLAADIDADGVVDLDDLVLVGANWQCTVLDTTPRCRRWRD